MNTLRLLSLAMCVVVALVFSSCGPAVSPGSTAVATALPSPGGPATAAILPSPPAATAAPAQAAAVPVTPTPIVAVRAAPSVTPGTRASPSTALTVDEYPVVSKDVDSPTRLEYRRRIDPMALEKRKQWREVAPQERMARMNEVLDRFGYMLSSTEQPGCPICVSFRLSSQGAPVVSDISHFWPPATSGDGSDFAMLVESRQGKSFVVRKSGVSPWNPMEHAFTAPAMLGTDLLTLDQPHPGKCEVRKGDEVIYSFVPPPQMVDNPIKGLWAWRGSWVLEVDGTVLVDGKSLNKEKGYDEVFGWRLIKGEPFYFFRKGSAIGVSYAGQILPYSYDEVIHYRCCEPAAFNVGGNDTMVWFHALRGGTYYYVEMGRYEGAAGGGG